MQWNSLLQLPFCPHLSDHLFKYTFVVFLHIEGCRTFALRDRIKSFMQHDDQAMHGWISKYTLVPKDPFHSVIHERLYEEFPIHFFEEKALNIFDKRLPVTIQKQGFGNILLDIEALWSSLNYSHWNRVVVGLSKIKRKNLFMAISSCSYPAGSERCRLLRAHSKPTPYHLVSLSSSLSAKSTRGSRKRKLKHQ